MFPRQTWGEEGWGGGGRFPSAWIPLRRRETWVGGIVRLTDRRQDLGKAYFTAFPMMWGPTGNHLMGGGCCSTWSSENWASSRSLQVSLVRWQPSPMCLQVGCKTCCHRKAQLPHGSATCSQKKSTPPCKRRECVTHLLHFLPLTSHHPLT